MIEGNAEAHAESAGQILALAEELRGLFGQLQTELDATAGIWPTDAYNNAQIHVDLQNAHAALADVAATVAAQRF